MVNMWIVIVVAIFLTLAIGTAVAGMKKTPRLAVPPAVPVDEDDAEGRHARQEAVAERGAELLDRRLELDARRGTLGGDSQLYAALEDLQNRLRSGEIDEAVYEKEKIRLLGG